MQNNEIDSSNQQKQNYDNDIDLDYIQSQLPVGLTEQEKKIREVLFKKFDVESNGKLNLAQIYKGFQGMGPKFKCIYSSKKCLLMSFNGCKNFSKNSLSSEYIDKIEFRYFLIYIRQYFEYLQLFKKGDLNQENLISLDEFKLSQEKLSEWGFNIKNLEEEFQKIDFDNSGSVNFDEFVDYAIKKSLSVISKNQVEAQKILMSKQINKNQIQEQRIYEAPFARTKSSKKSEHQSQVSEGNKITDQKNLEKKINQMTYEQLEELQNEFRIENMNIKEENRQIKTELLQLQKQALKNKF